MNVKENLYTKRFFIDEAQNSTKNIKLCEERESAAGSEGSSNDSMGSTNESGEEDQQSDSAPDIAEQVRIFAN